MRILVTGGRGRLGRKLVPLLVAAGHEVRVASRSSDVRLDLATGEGLDRAVDGVDVIVHSASAPFRDEQGVDVLGTRRLVEAAPHAHLVYPSIVGIDRVPTRYYKAKLDAEREVRLARHHTILRITQFHAFAVELVGMVSRWPIVPLLRVPLAPIDTTEAAEALVRIAASAPSGQAPDLGGPEDIGFDAITRAVLDKRGARKLRVPMPLLGAAGRALGAGGLVPTSGDRATIPFATWLAARDR